MWDNTLLSFDDLIATEYKNGFGEFFSSVLSKGLPKISDSDKKRPSMKPLPQGFKPSFSVPLPHLVNDLGVENLCTPYEWPFPEPRAVFAFRGGEDSALDRIEDYFTKKNGVKLLAKLEDCSGVMDSSTKLSPWISTGCISARQVYWEGYRTLEKNVDDHISNIWLKRFLWRDFLYLLCIHEGSTVFRDRTLNEDAPELPLYKKKSSNSHEFIRNRALIAWLEGSTGYPYIDAHIKELKTTGYISFRGRLNLSSFLVHQLDGEWQLGAEVFEHYLIDHDPVVNWGYWYYLYERCRDDNQEVPLDTVEEANKYDPEGFYVKKWINELVLLPPPFCHEPYLLSDEEQNLFEVVLGRDYPEPVLFPMVAKEIERARQLLSSSHSSSLDC